MANHVAVAIRYASVSLLLHAVICPHACKLIADWLSNPAVVCTCFEFLTSWVVDEVDNTVLAGPL